MIDPALGSLLLVGLELLFATAAFHKFRDLGRFSLVLAAYRVMPEGPARRLAWSFPCTELAVALALPWPAARRWAGCSRAAYNPCRRAAGRCCPVPASRSKSRARRKQ